MDIIFDFLTNNPCSGKLTWDFITSSRHVPEWEYAGCFVTWGFVGKDFAARQEIEKSGNSDENPGLLGFSETELPQGVPWGCWLRTGCLHELFFRFRHRRGGSESAFHGTRLI